MWLTAVLLLAGIHGSAHAARYWVSPDGDDASPGTRARPWQTLARANAAVRPGDTVVVRDGRYAGLIEPAASGRAAAPITYRAERRSRAVVTGGASRDGHPTCVRLREQSHIVIDGFELRPARGGWMRLDGARFCTIRHCRMEDSTEQWSPVECHDCHYNRYEDLQCHRAVDLFAQNGHVGGDLWNNYASTHNVFLRLHLSRAGHGLLVFNPGSDYNVVRQCVLDGRWGRDFSCFSASRLLLEQCAITHTLESTGSHGAQSQFSMIDSIFRRNLIYRNYFPPLIAYSYTYGDQTWKTLGTRLYHNTWVNNDEYGFEMQDLSPKPDPHMVAGNLLQNNVLAYNDPGGDGMALLLWTNIAEDNLFRYNALYGRRPGDKTVRYDWVFPGIGRWEGLAMTATEANIQKPAQFVGNLEAEPRFVNAERDDCRLRKDSPCVDAGRPLAYAQTAGAGRDILVDDARPFYDGFGIPGEQADLVFIGPRKQRARVVEADLSRRRLVLDRPVSWAKGDGISLPYVGAAPDLGAYERGAEREPWYQAPRAPEGLRLVTMDRPAAASVVVTDFEPEDTQEWFYYWNFDRQPGTDSFLDDTTAASGRRSMRVEAVGGRATLSCDIVPRRWDIDLFPTVQFAYRIPPGVPVGVWAHAFRSAARGRGAVCLGGSATRDTGAYRDLGLVTLLDDDQWHTVSFDVRAIRQLYPDVRLLRMFRFETNRNGRLGQRFWFDDFCIQPAVRPPTRRTAAGR